MSTERSRSLERTVRSTVRIGLFAGLTTGMLASLLLSEKLVPNVDRSALRDRRAKRWAGRTRRIFGAEVLADIPPIEAGPLLIVANHRAALDILILLELFGGHLVSRGDLAKWPLIGKAASSVGTVFVDRTSRTSGAGAIREVDRLFREGERVVLFPEGTTFEGDVVRPLQAASFLSAVRTKTRILPVGIAYQTGSGAAFVGETFGQHLKRAAGERRTRVALEVGTPLSSHAETGTRASLNEIAERVRGSLQRLVDSARERVDGT